MTKLHIIGIGGKMKMNRLKGLTIEEQDSMFPHNTILAGYRGSIAHGMYMPNSDPNSTDDKDLMGVTIAPLDTYFGLKHFEQKETALREWDTVTYEFVKFVRLLTKSNPNVLSILWLEMQHYIHIGEFGHLLIDNRNLFVSKSVYQAYTGYAYGQMKRMTAFEKKGYMGEKRKALVEKFGFDCKNSAHLIRLLRMGTEFLLTGELEVLRHDAPQLLEIKRGEWSLEKVKGEAEHQFRRAEEAYDKSTLPAKPDFEAINKLCVKILHDNFS